MKHLYSLVIAFVTLTSFNLITAQIIPNVTTTNDNMFNCSGTASAAPTGGTGVYSYIWSTGATSSSISNLCAGSYEVIVFDSNQDSAYVSFTITNPCSNIALTASATPATAGNCDGTVQATVTGGSGPYAFSISGGPQTGLSLFSNLCAGTYTVTVMDMNGCSAVATATVTDPCSNFTISATVTNATVTGTCDGMIHITPTGGNGPIQYSFGSGVFQSSGTFTGMCIGTYQLECIDALGCTAYTTATVLDSVLSTITPNLTSVDDSTGSCTGFASVSPTGGVGAYSYLWSNGATTNSISNLCAGTYSVTIWNTTDTITVNVTIQTLQNPCANFFASMSSTGPTAMGACDGIITVLPSGGTPPYAFNWSNAATTQSITNLCAGTYNLSVVCTDANGCNTTISDSIILGSNPCANFAVPYSVVFASNPVSCDGSATANPVNGTAPYSYTWSNGSTTQSISNLCNGTYTLTCVDANSCAVTVTVFVSDSIGTITNFSAYVNPTDDFTGNCDGSASIVISGGITPYTVLWSNGQGGGSISNLCAGIYSVTIWDSGTDSTTIDFIIADSSTTYGNNPFPNVTINDTLYTDLVTNCIIDYSVIDSASLYQAVYDSINQNLYVTWAIYSPTDTVYISDTLGLSGLPPGYYGLTISVYCPNKSGNDFFKIQSVIYFDGSNVWVTALGVDEHALDNISIYPNPFSNSISVDNTNGIIQSLKLVDLNGRILSEMPSVNSGIVKLDQLEAISSGTYLLILSGDNSSRTFKVIK